MYTHTHVPHIPMHPHPHPHTHTHPHPHTHTPQPETIQIADYYDLYNSLVVWSTRKWGCSGEHITGLFTENEDGKLQALQALKADHDVLNLRENEVVVVEIKD